MKSNEIEVVKVLIEHQDKELSIAQIAKFLKKDYKNVHNMVSRLVQRSLVELQPFGRSYRVMLHKKPDPLIIEAEDMRRKELLKNKDIKVMADTLKRLSTKFYILLIFGSHAKRSQTVHSDIDLMFIVPDAAEERLEKEINSISRTLPLKLHVNIFKEADFMAMKNSKEITVGSEAIKKNIILHGIESYYEMIQ